MKKKTGSIRLRMNSEMTNVFAGRLPIPMFGRDAVAGISTVSCIFYLSSWTREQAGIHKIPFQLVRDRGTNRAMLCIIVFLLFLRTWIIRKTLYLLQLFDANLLPQCVSGVVNPNLISCFVAFPRAVIDGRSVWAQTLTMSLRLWPLWMTKHVFATICCSLRC